MSNLNKNKIGLTLGLFLGLAHLIWAILVALIPSSLQNCLDWMFKIHGLRPYWIITTITFTDAILLVIVTFIAGYIVGWVYAYLHNFSHK